MIVSPSPLAISYDLIWPTWLCHVIRVTAYINTPTTKIWVFTHLRQVDAIPPNCAILGVTTVGTHTRLHFNKLLYSIKTSFSIPTDWESIAPPHGGILLRSKLPSISVQRYLQMVWVQYSPLVIIEKWQVLYRHQNSKQLETCHYVYYLSANRIFHQMSPDLPLGRKNPTVTAVA